MSENGDEKLNEAVELLKKVSQDPASVGKSDKRLIKKLIGRDSDLMIAALLKLQSEIDPDYYAQTAAKAEADDDRPLEEIVADNYIKLAKFAIEKSGLKNVSGLKVKEADGTFVIYALTPEPEELDFEQFATSDYPANKELLLEAEALQADLFMEDNTEEFKTQIKNLIENAKL